ncbi:MAG: hypothetical protein PHR63_06155, partial [Methanoregulaceae archaeon]|nr:hypothetical protein [Methanoregulaceae archaeon]
GALVGATEGQVKEVLMPVGPHYPILYRVMVISSLIVPRSCPGKRDVATIDSLYRVCCRIFSPAGRKREEE